MLVEVRAMTKQTESPPLPLHESDETAWLELTAGLIAQGRFDEIDQAALAEYLTDMAKRDRREVASRLTLLLAHLLKWQHQPEHRSNLWRATFLSQQHELEDWLDSATLRKHAEEILANSYGRAVQQATAETGLSVDNFPEACPYSIEWLLSNNLPE